MDNKTVCICVWHDNLFKGLKPCHPVVLVNC